MYFNNILIRKKKRGILLDPRWSYQVNFLTESEKIHFYIR